jgi:hypothetical protein
MLKYDFNAVFQRTAQCIQKCSHKIKAAVTGKHYLIATMHAQKKLRAIFMTRSKKYTTLKRLELVLYDLGPEYNIAIAYLKQIHAIGEV